jgi:hypothetical protein
MFGALLCSSLGGQSCIIQHLVSSHPIGGRPVLIRLKSLKELQLRKSDTVLVRLRFESSAQIWQLSMLSENF